MRNLPQPDPIAREHSLRLTRYISEKIHESNGQIPFSAYMHHALYAPGLGYYAAGKTKFGRDGDFVTSPEISPLFGQCIAKCINYPMVLELGAGTGKLAATLLQCCSALTHYYILEVSADCRTQQQATIQSLCPAFLPKVTWLDRLPSEKITGVVLANEVMDAFPATRFCWQDGKAYEYYVRYADQFYWQLDKPHDARISKFVSTVGLADNYASEMHLWLKPWIQSLSDILKEGLILLFDYGFPRNEFYHPDRHRGTLMCHYHHHAHENPFFYPGLQDITTHIDFTSVAEAAHESGLTIAGYTSQAAFLLDCGILSLAHDDNRKNQTKILTLPSEMGELFKAIALTRNHANPLPGFQLQDRRNRL
jgi:SAM-dependent MidA family methyltransferase